MRAKLTCRCGWVFFIEEVPPQGVACPHCGDPVETSGGEVRTPKPGFPAMAAMALVLVGLVGLAAFTLGSRTKPAPAQEPTVQKPPRPPGPPPEPPKDWAKLLDIAVARQNVSGVAARLMRLRANVDAARTLEDRLAIGETEILGFAEKANVPVPEHLRTDDVVITFEGTDYAAAAPPMRETALADALRLLGPGAVWEIVVKRGLDRVELRLDFGDVPREVRTIAEAYHGLKGATAKPPDPVPDPPPGVPDPPAPPPGPAALPADVVAAVREKILKLPPYYRGFLTDEEHARIETLLAAGKGMPEDVEFLTARVLTEAGNAAADDQAFVRSQAVESEGRAKQAGVAGLDVVVKTDGSRLEGRILSRDDEGVKLEVTRNQVKGIVAIAAKDVAEVRSGAGAAAEFESKFKEAKGRADALADLAKWCAKTGLAAHREWLYWLALEADPANETARMALGFVRAGRIWTKEREVKPRGQVIDYAGKTYTPEAFAAMLRSRGYVELNGLWYARKPWGLRVANLYRDEDKIAVGVDNALVADRVRLETERIIDPQSKQPRDVIRKVTVGRMIGPLGKAEDDKEKPETFKERRGTATIVIEAPAGFIDCRIKAVGEVTVAGGVVRVWVTNEDGGSKELYRLDTVKRHESAVDVSEIARGRRKITLHAEMSSPWVSSDNGTAMFLPGTRNDTAVLDVSAQIADPLNAVNAAVAASKDKK